VTAVFDRHPENRLKMLAAVDLGFGRRHPSQPRDRSLWMLAVDLLAASMPVILCALFTLNVARWISLAVTSVLLVRLGTGRAAIGNRRVVPTVLDTIAIAADAAAAGVLVGKLTS
jgi:hypothetical protein